MSTPILRNALKNTHRKSVEGLETGDAVVLEFDSRFGLKKGDTGVISKNSDGYVSAKMDKGGTLVGFRVEENPFRKVLTEDGGTKGATDLSDAAYLEAVRRGDLGECGRMVAAAARKRLAGTQVVDESGNPLVVYHSSKSDSLKSFDIGFVPAGNVGFHFGPKEVADTVHRMKSERHAPKAYYLDIRNPMRFSEDCFGTSSDLYNEHSVAGEILFQVGRGGPAAERLRMEFERMDAVVNDSGRKHGGGYRYSDERLHALILGALEEGGYDGIVYWNTFEGDGNECWVALYPDQVKSADPVTRYGDGSVVPLSKRFNPYSDMVDESMAGGDVVARIAELVSKYDSGELSAKGVADGIAALSRETEVPDPVLRFTKAFESAADALGSDPEGFDETVGSEYVDDVRDWCGNPVNEKTVCEEWRPASRSVSEAARRAMPNTKAVDSEGYPMMLYHGTSSYGFREFDGNSGFWASTSRRYAEEYTESGGFGRPGVYRVFMNVENPLEVGRLDDDFDDDSVNALAENMGVSFDELSDWMCDSGFDWREGRFPKWDVTTSALFVEWLRELGFDGMHATEGPRDAETWCAFDSNQVKSAEDVTYNEDGTEIPAENRFDMASNDINEGESEEKIPTSLPDEDVRGMEEMFGTTDDVRDAYFIMPDGKWLDMTNVPPEYYKKYSIWGPEHACVGLYYGNEPSTAIRDALVRLGMIRFTANNGPYFLMQIEREPTSAQWDSIERIIMRDLWEPMHDQEKRACCEDDEPVFALEMMNGSFVREYDVGNFKNAFRDIKSFFNGGSAESVVRQFHESDDTDSDCEVIVSRTSYGYEAKIGSQQVGICDITVSSGERIIEELSDSVGYEPGFREIDPNKRTAYIEDISVDHGVRNCGIGTKMMKRIVGDYGSCQIVLRAFDTDGKSDPDRLVGFYRMFGFHEIASTDSDGTVMLRLADSPKKVVKESSDSDDDAYLAAAKTKNYELCRKMVEEKAKVAFAGSRLVTKDGMPIKLYHGTAFNIHKFWGGLDTITWVTPDIDYADVYADYDRHLDADNDGVIMSLYVYARNMVDIGDINEPFSEEGVRRIAKAIGCTYDELRSSIGKYDYDFLYEINEYVASIARNKGIDILVAKEGDLDRGVKRKVVTIGVLDFNNIKSADPITKYEDGTIVPLSKRFDFGTDDIREDAGGADGSSFANWFGSSVVRDVSGKPLVVYHGSSKSGITEFNKVRPGSGIFFTSSKEVANDYAVGKENRIYPCYLRIEHPFVIDAHGSKWSDMKFKEHRAITKYAGYRWITPLEVIGYVTDVYQSEHPECDGIIIRNVVDTNASNVCADDYIVFNPKQIKSVDNGGKFSGDTANIFESRV